MDSDAKDSTDNLDGEFYSSLAAGTLGAQEVVLSAGDLLYIPPYWWHRASVTGSQVSMSIAAYTYGNQMEMYDLLKAHQVPVSPEFTWNQKVAALKVYVCAIAALQLDSSSVAEVHCDRWILALLAQRYAPLSHAQSRNIEVGWTAMVHKYQRHFLWLTRELRIPAGLNRQLEAHASRLQNSVQGLALRLGGLDPAIWTTELQSLVEDVCNSVVGTRFVEPFLQYLSGGLVLWGTKT